MEHNTIKLKKKLYITNIFIYAQFTIVAFKLFSFTVNNKRMSQLASVLRKKQHFLTLGLVSFIELFKYDLKELHFEFQGHGIEN